MARNVFKSYELPLDQHAVKIMPPELFTEQSEPETEAVAVYDGPTVAELEEEANQFRLRFEEEKREMIRRAQEEIEAIRSAEKDDLLRMKNEAVAEADAIREAAKKDAEETAAKAKADAEAVAAEAEASRQAVVDEARKEGFEAGRKEGYDSGKEEADRLINKLHVMLSGVADKRQRIIDESESLIVDLILNIVRKVVRSITESQKDAVVNTVLKALSKLKTSADVTLRVNFDDAALTTEHMKQFLKKVEKAKSITVIEDSSVDRGGCIVETDYGSIDARISSQLREIEDKIRELSPLVTQTN